MIKLTSIITFHKTATLMALLLVLGTATACSMTHNNPMAKEIFNNTEYMDRVDSVIKKIKANPDYVRIPIDSDSQAEEFMILSYKLYKGEISKDAFTSSLTSSYPDPKYKNTISWLAEQYQQ